MLAMNQDRLFRIAHDRSKHFRLLHRNLFAGTQRIVDKPDTVFLRGGAFGPVPRLTLLVPQIDDGPDTVFPGVGCDILTTRLRRPVQLSWKDLVEIASQLADAHMRTRQNRQGDKRDGSDFQKPEDGTQNSNPLKFNRRIGECHPKRAKTSRNGQTSVELR